MSLSRQVRQGPTEAGGAGRPAPNSAGRPQRHLVTVGLEDYFHVGAFNRLIQHGEWYRFEMRLERGTVRTLDLLDEFGVRATFFTLGWVADQAPELVRLVAERGHEIASKGYYHRSIHHMTRAELRDDLSRAREALQRASGQPVTGFRLADGWFRIADLWALDVLAEEGYEYDSSVGPVGRGYASQPWRRFVHSHQFGDRTLWEFPISTFDLLGFQVPIAGGNYFRQLPQVLVRRAVRHWMRTYSAPFVMYFHTWELDPDQPKITAASRTAKIRHYRNLDRFSDILRYYLQRYRFTAIGDYLGITTPVSQRAAPPAIPPRVMSAPATTTPGGDPGGDTGRVPVSVVVPVYNEELILPYLANTLESVRDRLGRRYQLQFIFVDDASRDGTWETLGHLFGDRPDCRLVRHADNQGVARGILTGIRQAATDIVCSIDCDCTYDPHELEQMIPLLTDDVALVTASPYHPAGHVRNVPAWRLRMSRTLSAMYRAVLPQKLYTYTSCFRVYRRSAFLDVQLSRSGFLGVAEMLGLVGLAGGRVVEYPATLEVRLLGRSKMKVLRTILGHLGLLWSLAWLRLRSPVPQRAPHPTPPVSAPERTSSLPV